MIKGFQHNITTNNDTPIYKLPYHKSPSELSAIKEELHCMLKLHIIEPSTSEWNGHHHVSWCTNHLSKEFRRLHDSWLITRTLTLLLWVTDVPYHQLIIFWMQFVTANTLVNWTLVVVTGSVTES